MPAIFSIIAIVGALGLVLAWSWGRLAPLFTRLRSAASLGRVRRQTSEAGGEPRLERASGAPSPVAEPEPSTEFIDKDELFASADAARSSGSPGWPDDGPATEFLSLEDLDPARAKAAQSHEDEGPTQIFSRADFSRASGHEPHPRRGR